MNHKFFGAGILACGDVAFPKICANPDRIPEAESRGSLLVFIIGFLGILGFVGFPRLPN